MIIWMVVALHQGKAVWCDKSFHLQLRSVTPVLWSSRWEVCWARGRKRAAGWWRSQSWRGRRKGWTWAATWGTGNRRGRWCQTCRQSLSWCPATGPGSAWLTVYRSRTCGETERTACDIYSIHTQSELFKCGVAAYCFRIDGNTHQWHILRAICKTCGLARLLGRLERQHLAPVEVEHNLVW